MIVDTSWMILRVRDAGYKFTEKKPLAVRPGTAEGVELKRHAVTGGRTWLTFASAPSRRRATRCSRPGTSTSAWILPRCDSRSRPRARVDSSSINCMTNIGTPSQRASSKDEFDQLFRQVKRGTAKCSENKRTRVTTCDVD